MSKRGMPTPHPARAARPAYVSISEHSLCVRRSDAGLTATSQKTHNKWCKQARCGAWQRQLQPAQAIPDFHTHDTRASPVPSHPRAGDADVRHGARVSYLPTPHCPVARRSAHATHNRDTQASRTNLDERRLRQVQLCRDSLHVRSAEPGIAIAAGSGGQQTDRSRVALQCLRGKRVDVVQWDRQLLRQNSPTQSHGVRNFRVPLLRMHTTPART